MSIPSNNLNLYPGTIENALIELSRSRDPMAISKAQENSSSAGLTMEIRAVQEAFNSPVVRQRIYETANSIQNAYSGKQRQELAVSIKKRLESGDIHTLSSNQESVLH